MASNVVIVESPAKAKTIEKILGKDFVVLSSYGHIRDLCDKGIAIDIKNNFKPEYCIPPDKKDVIKKLKEAVASAQKVWLASDEDREGEAISWHLAEVLKLDPVKTDRIVFHEITKSAIERAIQNPRKIDMHLVDAQQARRILDRIVGYELSPVLWKKVKGGLSAGRVQSVAVRLIVDREREIEKFTSESAFRVVAEFIGASGKGFKAELNHRFKNAEEAMKFMEACQQALFTITGIEQKPGKRSPAAPFTTSTLQQEAARKLGFSVNQTMSVAQQLYEAGFITYMRTDSVNLSNDAIGAAKAEIAKSFGEKYSHVRKFTTKNKGAQEAHEAIRPTYMSNHSAGTTDQQKRLYDLIWKRTMASQMADAQLERTVANINISTSKYLFVARGEVITFDGFLKLYQESTDDEETEDSNMLPALKNGEKLQRNIITATEKFSNHPPRYTEASLVRALEELGIGRPSTYAPTITTVQKRGYVVKKSLEGKNRNYTEITLEDGLKSALKKEVYGADRNKLFPTDIGLVVNDFLVEHCQVVMDYQFTAKAEEEFDLVAEGKTTYQLMLKDFYRGFHDMVVKAEDGEFFPGKKLGNHPKNGKPVYSRLARYGWVVQIGDATDDEKPEFASIPEGNDPFELTLNDALEFFKLPRMVGELNGQPIVVNAGRFGPYVLYEKKFYSLPKGTDLFKVSLDEATKIIAAGKEKDANRVVRVFDQEKPVIELLRGPYGVYIKSEKKNYKIPKDVDPISLSREECLHIMKNQPASKGRGRAKTPRKKK